MKPVKIREKLIDKGLKIFTSSQFGQLFNLNSNKTKYELTSKIKEGLFIRLKKGIYALSTDMPTDEEVANALYRPSYISLEYALSYYNILPEMVYAVTSLTTKPTRNFYVQDTLFSYNTIKREAFTGYISLSLDSNVVLIADKEKAFVDYIYFLILNKKSFNDRISIQLLDKDKIRMYMRLYDRKNLNNMIESLL
ncbi:MAG: type IV toxin-antitoxin system AbiEi family antitoxin domain-containing protein [Patescibacteria group bacterium]